MINANYGLNSNLTVGSGFTVFLSNSDVNSGNIFATSVSTSGNISASSVVASGVISASSATIGGNISALNINVSGNIIMPNGTVTVSNVATVAGQFFGNASGFGALYAGLTSGFVFQPQTIIQSSSNFNGYSQFNMQNINSGNSASSD